MWHLVVHLLRTVKYVHHNTQGPAQVFSGLSLPSACRASWGSTHCQVK